MVILAFNNVDRLALGLVLQDVKADLRLNDSELGLLSGIAFAVFYSLLGIPIARWADRGDRVFIIGLTTAAWSVAVALCGVARTFIQLMAIRVAVGIGEAGCVPPAHSLIADYFARRDRPRALAVYLQGYSASVILGYLVAGWLDEKWGWRAMFVLIGLPGLVLGAIAYWTLKEPRRHAQLSTANAKSDHGITLRQTWLILSRNRAYRNLLLGYGLLCFFSYGAVNWQPAFFIRSFGVDTAELGGWLTLVYGVFGVAGTYLGGLAASRWAAHDEERQLKACAVINLAFNGLLWALIYVVHDYRQALALMAISTFGGAAILGPIYASIQTLAPERIRAMAIALVLLFVNLVGLGFGPLSVGVLSDALRPFAGDESLRYALLAMSPGYLLVSWYLWRASRTFSADLIAIPEALGQKVIASHSSTTVS